MHPTRSAKEIFLDALDLPPHERAAFVAQACADDEPLRKSVEGLLATHEEVGDRFSVAPHLQPPSGFNSPPLEDDAESTDGIDGLERYKLLRILGQGGFGIVWLAEQQRPIRRNVAVKLLRPGLLGLSLSPEAAKELLARFDAERQALAMLEHPAIARVFEAGSTNASGIAQPYFVMEYVDGPPITTYAEQQHLPLRERLRLFVEVCRGVQHAHQKGLIHRDLKPGNVLIATIDKVAVPKVIDFGIAKAVDQQTHVATNITQQFQVVGTPQYMSPEQTQSPRVSVDTRSDVYALGVILYELLTQSPPIESDSIRESSLEDICKRIREEVPERPSRKASAESGKPRLTISNELDWITMKALEKDPARRYQSAAELAEDIERSLRDEPVLASPPSVTYRMKKFVRRNRIAVTAAALVAATVVAGLAVSIVLTVEARRQRAAAELNLSEANAVSNFLSNMFKSVEATEKGYDVRVAELLGEAETELEKFAGSDNAKAAIASTLADAYIGLGDRKRALPLYEKSDQIQQRVLGPDDPRTLRTRMNIAGVHLRSNEYEKALAVNSEVVERYKRRFGLDHETTLGALNNQALIFDNLRRYDESLAIHQQVLDGTIRVMGADHPRVFGARMNLCNTLVDLRRYDEALKLLQGAREEAVRIYGAEDVHVGLIDMAFGNLYIEIRKPVEAEKHIRTAESIYTKLYGPTHPETLTARLNRMTALNSQGRFAESVDPLSDLVKRALPEFGPTHRITTGAMLELTDTFSTLGIPNDEQLIANVREILKANIDNPSISPATQNNFASMLYESPPPLFDPQTAVAMARKVVERSRDDSFYFGYLDTLAMALYKAGERDEALSTAKLALVATPDSEPEARAEIEKHIRMIEEGR